MSPIVMVDAFLSKLPVRAVEFERRSFDGLAGFSLNGKPAKEIVFADDFTEDDLDLHLFTIERLDSLVYALIDHREPFIDARGFTLLNPKSRKFDFHPSDRVHLTRGLNHAA